MATRKRIQTSPSSDPASEELGSPATVYVNKEAIECLVFHGGPDKTEPMYRVVREAAQRIGGKATGASLKVPDSPSATLPSLMDIQLWLDSIEDGDHEDANYVRQLQAALETRISDKFRKRVIRESN